MDSSAQADRIQEPHRPTHRSTAEPRVSYGKQARRWSLARLLRWALLSVFLTGALGLAGTLAFAWLFPQQLTEMDLRYLRIVTVIFFLRTYQHLLALGMVVCGLGLYVTGLRKAGLLAIVGAAAATWPIFSHKLSRPPTVAPTTPRLKVMSANLWQFNHNVDLLVAEIRRVDPDVLIVQELMSWHWQAINDHFGKSMPYSDMANTTGIASVWSKYPLKADPPTQWTRFGMFRPAELNWHGTKIAIYGLHLVSPRGTSTIATNRQQVNQLINLVKSETRPTILAGDFNATSLSPQLIALRHAGYTDAFEAASTEWLGMSWYPKVGPQRHLSTLASARIDHIFTCPKLQPVTFQTGNYIGSDHRPVFAELVLKY